MQRFPLFPNADSPVVLVLQDIQKAAAELKTPVGKEAYPLPAQTVAGNTAFDILDQPLQIAGSASASAAIHAEDDTVDPFGTGAEIAAPAGTAWSELDLRAGLQLAGKAANPGGTLKLSAKLAAGGALRYRRLLPARLEDTRAAAFLALAQGSHLPDGLDLLDLEDGEVHHYAARFGLYFDAEVVTGQNISLQQDLTGLTNLLGSAFDDLSPTLLAEVDAGFKATLGLALAEEMKVTVGRAGTLEEDWVRLRIERASERRFSAGATFSLQVRYQGAGAANAILDRAFSLLPTSRALDTFKEINGLLADGDWDTVKGRLSTFASSQVAAWLDDTGWRDKLADSEEIRQLIAVSTKVVDEFRGLNERVESLWSRLLGEAHLGADSDLRKALDKVAGLDVSSLRQDLVDQNSQLGEALALFEVLSGRSLEEVVLSSDNDLGRAVTEAKDVAQDALDFLGRLEGLPGKVLDRFHRLAEKSGVADVVAWLSENATSVEQLEGAIDERLRGSVERVVDKLTGKAFGALGDEERAKVEKWAGKLQEVLDTGKLEDRLRAAAAKLDGELGFSLALEMERLTQETALLDMELDPRDTATRQAVSGPLRSGAVGEILKELPQPEGDDPAPYRLRECVFLSRRVRTAAVHLFFNLTGLKSSRNRWITERTIRLSQKGNKVTRHGLWDGGFVRSNIGGDADLFEAGVWVNAEATGAGSDLAAPYGAPDVDLRMTLQREDAKTTIQELGHYSVLLGQLGFTKVAGDPDLPSFAAGTTLDTRFALALGLPDGLSDLVSGVNKGKPTQAWMDDYLEGARRWWEDPLITRPSSHVVAGNERVRLGRVLAALLDNAEFRRLLIKGQSSVTNKYKNESVEVKIGQSEVGLRIIQPTGGWHRDYKSVQELAKQARKSYEEAHDLGEQLSKVHKADDSVSAAALDELSERAAKAFSAATVKLWSNPALAVWFILARLSRLEADAIKDARGLATLRWRTGPEEEWNDPIRYVLKKDGLAALRKAGGAFD